MTTAIQIRDLPAWLEEALALAAVGGEVVLLDGRTPRARLVPWSPLPQRTAGLHLGAFHPASDFDE